MSEIGERKALLQARPAMCPMHGRVEAVRWHDALVCPDPECHRTCEPLQAAPRDLIELARLLLTPTGIRGDREWVEARIRWHRLDGNDTLADEMQAEENRVRRALGKDEIHA